MPDKYKWNFDKSTEEEVKGLEEVMREQERAEGFERYFSKEFEYSCAVGDREREVLEEVRAYDERERERENVREMVKGGKIGIGEERGNSKWTQRAPLRLKSINRETFSSRVKF